GFPESQTPERIGGLERVVEEPAVIVDPRETGDPDQLLSQYLFPQLFRGPELGEETVPTDIEAVPLVLHRSRDAADRVVPFEHGDPDPVLGQEVGGGQPARPRTDDDDVISGTQPRDRATGRCPFARARARGS